LCNRGIYLQTGKLALDGNPQQAIGRYLDSAYSDANNVPLEQRKDRQGNGKLTVSGFRVLNSEGEEQQAMRSGDDYYFEISYKNNVGNSLTDIVVSLDFHDDKNVRVMMLKSRFTNSQIILHHDGGSIVCGIKNLILANSSYRVAIFVSRGDNEVLDYLEDAASIHVDGGDFFGTGSTGLSSHCKILVKAEWFSQEKIQFNAHQRRATLL